MLLPLLLCLLSRTQVTGSEHEPTERHCWPARRVSDGLSTVTSSNSRSICGGRDVEMLWMARREKNLHRECHMTTTRRSCDNWRLSVCLFPKWLKKFWMHERPFWLNIWPLLQKCLCYDVAPPSSCFFANITNGSISDYLQRSWGHQFGNILLT